MTDAPCAVTLRPRRYIVLAIASVCAGLSVLVLIAAIGTQRVDQFAWFAGLFLATAAGAANFLWLCYARINDDGIEQVNFFRLLRHFVPVTQMRYVELTTHRNVALMSVPSLVVEHANGRIEFSAAKYDERSLLEAAQCMKRLGLPTQPDLISRLTELQNAS